MSVCPVCQYHHQEEVSKCQRCNWSMQDDLNSMGISSDHPILSICIPKLVKSLEDRNNLEEKLSLLIQTSDPDIQQKNNERLDKFLDKLENYKLDKLLDRLETEREKYIQEIKDFQTQVLEELKNSLDSKNHDGIDFGESDREENNLFNMNNNDRENSLSGRTGDRPSSETNDTQENIAPEVNSNRNYQSFYRLINNGEFEVTKVTVPQETMEKMRGGTLSEFKFINDRKGNYWIVNWHNVYCLIPKEKTYINQYQYGNFQRVFECQNYKETYSDFEIIEPAVVFKCDDQTWQLERKGKIKFI